MINATLDSKEAEGRLTNIMEFQTTLKITS